jgi:hypothetical protein
MSCVNELGAMDITQLIIGACKRENHIKIKQAQSS